MRIAELGHTGLWVNDLETMKDLYTRVRVRWLRTDHPREQARQIRKGIATSRLPLATPLCHQFLPLTWQVAPPLEDL